MRTIGAEGPLSAVKMVQWRPSASFAISASGPIFSARAGHPVTHSGSGSFVVAGAALVQHGRHQVVLAQLAVDHERLRRTTRIQSSS
ncbi:MAG: hypothetical protein V8S24_02530 [Gordonibacter pamelaeae]